MKLKYLYETMDLGREVDGIDYMEVEGNGLKYSEEIIKENENKFRFLINEWYFTGQINEETWKEYTDIIDSVRDWNQMQFDELEKLLHESIQEDVERDEILEWEVNR